jgi:hypothetical protein
MTNETIDNIIRDCSNLDDGLHERKVGRYYCSEIYAIKAGYKTVKNFFIKEDKNLLSAKRITSGNILEAGFEKLLKDSKWEHEYNPKYEIPIDDFVVVVKPDFIFKECVIETKCPSTFRDWNYLLNSYKYQLQAEHIVTGKDVYLGKFVMENGNEFGMKLIKFEPNDKIWEEAVGILRKFDSSLKIYLQKYGTNKSSSQILEVPTSNKL